MQAINRKRAAFKSSITRMENLLNAHDVNPVTERCLAINEERLEGLINYRLSLIEEACEKAADDAEFDAEAPEYLAIEVRLLDLKDKIGEIRELLNPGSRTPSSTATASTAGSTAMASDIRLPRLELPSFNGNRQDWLTFHDLFQAAVHQNDKLSGAQKLQYLKASVKGEAATLIQPYKISDDNYTEAWTTLKARYEDKRELLNAALDRLLAVPSLTAENPSSLQKLGDRVRECVHAVDILNVPRETAYELQLIHLVSKKLDTESRLQWERKINKDELPSIGDFCKFIDHQARVTEVAKSSGKTRQDTKKQGAAVHHGASQDGCPICSEGHPVYMCKKFKAMKVHERWSSVRKHQLCFNCLGSTHRVTECQSSHCKQCSQPHHSLLHTSKQDTEKRPAEKKQQQPPPEAPTATLFATSRRTKGLLSTALIRVRDSKGIYHVCRALLDNGAETSFVTTSCATRLGLRRQKIHVPLSGLASCDAGTSTQMVDMAFTSCHKFNPVFNVDCLVLKHITRDMPSSPVHRQEWKHIQGLELADPNFHEMGKIDILLGSDIYFDLILSGKRTGPAGTPTALRSKLGWLLGGKLNGKEEPRAVASHLVYCDMDETMKKFWELEEIPRKTFLTPDEKACEDHFTTTHTRDETGRFVLRLPIKPDAAPLGDSRQRAIKRMKAVERRLEGNPDLKKQYHDVLEEYLHLNHMEMVPASEVHIPNTYYMPHHVVINESSSTTKFRVVFDASAVSSNGTSLNKNLMVGPKLQEDLVSILVRFRTHKIAFTADITKMYRQVRVHRDDTNLQRIVWRKDPKDPIRDYRMLTATFGTASAPYMAIKSVQQLATDEKARYPKVEKTILRDFYVDDLMSGAATEEEGLTMQKELLGLLSQAGMELRKWFSNSTALLMSLPENLRGSAHTLAIEEDEQVKTLGLQWHPGADHFSFKVADAPNVTPTKRTVLSDIAKVFDPLGWLTPVTIKAKMFMQQMWKEDLGWDDPLPQHLQDEWTYYRSHLHLVERVTIPRFISQENPTHQLHGFCDASESAYAAVVFLRSKNPDGHIHVRMVAAKSKVAPVKNVTLARLELCGSVLLIRLLQCIQQALCLNIEATFGWTDSTIVLAWLASPPHRWKTFVANRVSEIQDVLPRSSWRHVRSKDNPADCASRGISPDSLANQDLWWTGPEWLCSSEEHWPNFIEELSVPPKEERTPLAIHQVIIDEPDSLLERYSELMKLLRITSYCLRVRDWTRRKKTNVTFLHQNSSLVTKEELDRALMTWVRVVQNSAFPDDFRSLVQDKKLTAGSQLKKLSPFVDDHGVIRVGGRLQHSELFSDAKHPIVLPKKGFFTKLIIAYYHHETLHAGPQALLTAIQQKYWILAGRDVIRHFVRSCVTCCRFQAQLVSQKMGELPASRVQPAFPFLRTGVDYTGPFWLTARRGRGQKKFKTWIALFVCMVSRAIHLELVSDMTTETFIAAFRRFVSRRGKPTDMYSDCGTNFVGAKRVLKEDLQLVQNTLDDDKWKEELAKESISWHLNPPASPNFGGIWESGVKSMKYHLHRVVGETILTQEEMTTLLAQVEACLNSRPMTELSSDPADLMPLTPGHFLIGRPLTALADPGLTHLKENRLSRWERVQQMFQHFWKRWSTEFLTRLQPRNKWLTAEDNVQIGTIVLLKEDNVPPAKWILGRIVETTLGPDDLVRVVTVKTATGELRRPVSKLCILPIQN